MFDWHPPREIGPIAWIKPNETDETAAMIASAIAWLPRTSAIGKSHNLIHYEITAITGSCWAEPIIEEN